MKKYTINILFGATFLISVAIFIWIVVIALGDFQTESNEQQVYEIGCKPQALYNYIKQPWRWHEWHPNSGGAKSMSKNLQVGDTFQENFELQLFSFPPVKVRTLLSWTVMDDRPPSFWEIRALADNGAVIRFEYHFEQTDSGVRFTRTLNYMVEDTLVNRIIGPRFRRLNAEMSKKAMNNLKRICESGTLLNGESKP